MPMRHLSRTAAALLLCLGAWSAAAAELGTLFYSPAQRSEIERARRGEAGQAQEQAQKRLSGVVRRANGKSTVWVNGEALPEGAAGTPPLRGMDAVVQQRRLRVGEAVDALTGETSDVVPPGSVRAGSQAARDKKK